MDDGLGEVDMGKTQSLLSAEVEPATSKGKANEPGISEVGGLRSRARLLFSNAELGRI